MCMLFILDSCSVSLHFLYLWISRFRFISFFYTTLTFSSIPSHSSLFIFALIFFIYLFHQYYYLLFYIFDPYYPSISLFLKLSTLPSFSLVFQISFILPVDTTVFLLIFDSCSFVFFSSSLASFFYSNLFLILFKSLFALFSMF